MKYFLIYLLVVNLMGIGMVAWDKLVAVKGWNVMHQRKSSFFPDAFANIPAKNLMRVPEKNLFLVALLGGAPGEYVTMRLIRHKTLHKSFMVGLPLIFAVEAVLALAVYFLL